MVSESEIVDSTGKKKGKIIHVDRVIVQKKKKKDKKSSEKSTPKTPTESPNNTKPDLIPKDDKRVEAKEPKYTKAAKAPVESTPKEGESTNDVSDTPNVTLSPDYIAAFDELVNADGEKDISRDAFDKFYDSLEPEMNDDIKSKVPFSQENWQQLENQNDIVKHIVRNNDGDELTVDSVDAIPSGYYIVKTIVVKSSERKIIGTSKLEVTKEFGEPENWLEFENENETFKYVVKDQNGKEVIYDDKDNIPPEMEIINTIRLRSKQRKIVGDSKTDVTHEFSGPEKWQEFENQREMVKYVVRDANGKEITLDSIDNLPADYELVKTVKFKTNERKIIGITKLETKLEVENPPNWQETENQSEVVQYVCKDENGDEHKFENLNEIPQNYQLIKTIKFRTSQRKIISSTSKMSQNQTKLLINQENQQSDQLDPVAQESNLDLIEYIVRDSNGVESSVTSLDNLPPEYQLVRTLKYYTQGESVIDGNAEDLIETVKYIVRDDTGNEITLDTLENMPPEYTLLKTIMHRTIKRKTTQSSSWQQHDDQSVRYLVRGPDGKEETLENVENLPSGYEILKTMITAGERIATSVSKQFTTSENWQAKSYISSNESKSLLEHGEVMKYIFRDENGKEVTLDDVDTIPPGYELLKAYKFVANAPSVISALDVSDPENWKDLEKRSGIIKYLVRAPNGEETYWNNVDEIPADHEIIKALKFRLAKSSDPELEVESSDAALETEIESLDPAVFEAEVKSLDATALEAEVTSSNNAHESESKPFDLSALEAQIEDSFESPGIVKFVCKDENGKEVTIDDTDELPAGYEIIKSFKFVAHQPTLINSLNLNESIDLKEFDHQSEIMKYVARDPTGKESLYDNVDDVPETWELVKSLKFRIAKPPPSEADTDHGSEPAPSDEPDEAFVEPKSIIKFICRDEKGNEVTLDDVNELPDGYEVLKSYKFLITKPSLVDSPQIDDPSIMKQLEHHTEIIRYLVRDSSGKEILLDSLDNMSPDCELIKALKFRMGKSTESSNGLEGSKKYVIQNEVGKQLVVDHFDDIPKGYGLVKCLDFNESKTLLKDLPGKKANEVIKYVVRAPNGTESTVDSLDDVPTDYEIVKSVKFVVFGSSTITQQHLREMENRTEMFKYIVRDANGTELTVDNCEDIPEGFELVKALKFTVLDSPNLYETTSNPDTENETVQYWYQDESGNEITLETDNPPTGYKLVKILRIRKTLHLDTNGHFDSLDATGTTKYIFKNYNGDEIVLDNIDDAPSEYELVNTIKIGGKARTPTDTSEGFKSVVLRYIVKSPKGEEQVLDSIDSLPPGFSLIKTLEVRPDGQVIEQSAPEIEKNSVMKLVQNVFEPALKSKASSNSSDNLSDSLSMKKSTSASSFRSQSSESDPSPVKEKTKIVRHLETGSIPSSKSPQQSSSSQRTDKDLPSLDSLSERSISADSFHACSDDGSAWYSDYRKNQNSSASLSFDHKPRSKAQYDSHIAEIKGSLI